MMPTQFMLTKMNRTASLKKAVNGLSITQSEVSETILVGQKMSLKLWTF